MQRSSTQVPFGRKTRMVRKRSLRVALKALKEPVTCAVSAAASLCTAWKLTTVGVGVGWLKPPLCSADQKGGGMEPGVVRADV